LDSPTSGAGWEEGGGGGAVGVEGEGEAAAEELAHPPVSLLDVLLYSLQSTRIAQLLVEQAIAASEPQMGWTCSLVPYCTTSELAQRPDFQVCNPVQNENSVVYFAGRMLKTHFRSGHIGKSFFPILARHVSAANRFST